MADFFTSLADEIGAELMDDVDGSFEYIDTGSYILNAVVSGSIYGGIRDNKVIGFGGAQATGKTFFVLSLVKNFLDSDPAAGVVYFDTEGAIDKDEIENRGIDMKRFIIKEPETIEEFRTEALRMLKHISESKKAPRIMMCLDSLGNLSSLKELEDIETGKTARDMTKAQLIRGAFRSLTLKTKKLHIPFLVTNHTYAVVGAYVPTNELSGGSGLKYCGSTIMTMTKSKDKDGKDVIGAILKVKMYKSRFTREEKVVEVKLNHSTGLDRYYGLLPIAEKYGIVKKVGNKYEFTDGSKAFEKTIYKNPEKYFTKEILDQIDDVCKIEFLYGTGEQSEDDDLEFIENEAE